MSQFFVQQQSAVLQYPAVEFTPCCCTLPDHVDRRNCAGLTKAAGTVDTLATMVKLWTHEVLRVFHDRLTDNQDRVWMGKAICEMLETHFKEKGTSVLGIKSMADEELIGGMRSILFADFLVPGADPKLYKCAFLPPF